MKPNELEFLNKCQKAKEEMKARKKFIDLIEGRNYQGREYLREIEIIQEAFQKVCMK